MILSKDWFLPDIPAPANIFEIQNQSSHLPTHAPYNSSYNSSIYAQRLEPSICPECLQTQIRTSQQTLLGAFRWLLDFNCRVYSILEPSSASSMDPSSTASGCPSFAIHSTQPLSSTLIGFSTSVPCSLDDILIVEFIAIPTSVLPLLSIVLGLLLVFRNSISIFI
jgi:hypothetical protein